RIARGRAVSSTRCCRAASRWRRRSSRPTSSPRRIRRWTSPRPSTRLRARSRRLVAETRTATLPHCHRACLGERVERTPIWIMRQAGRYLPEYRALRERHDFLTSCRTPELACEITLQPVRRLEVDAAILFSDILVPLPGMGLDVTFNPGPHLARTIRTEADVRGL